MCGSGDQVSVSDGSLIGETILSVALVSVCVCGTLGFTLFCLYVNSRVHVSGTQGLYLMVLKWWKIEWRWLEEGKNIFKKKEREMSDRGCLKREPVRRMQENREWDAFYKFISLLFVHKFAFV